MIEMFKDKVDANLLTFELQPQFQLDYNEQELLNEKLLFSNLEIVDRKK